MISMGKKWDMKMGCLLKQQDDSFWLRRVGKRDPSKVALSGEHGDQPVDVGISHFQTKSSGQIRIIH